MYGLYDAWVGTGADFSLCLCLRCLGSLSKFHPSWTCWMCQADCIRLITTNTASFTPRSVTF